MVGCLGQGQEWGLCPGHYREGLCDLTTGHATDHCGQPWGHDGEGNKAAQRSLKEMNYCAHSNECLFDEKNVIW